MLGIALAVLLNSTPDEDAVRAVEISVAAELAKLRLQQATTPKADPFQPANQKPNFPANPSVQKPARKAAPVQRPFAQGRPTTPATSARVAAARSTTSPAGTATVLTRTFAEPAGRRGGTRGCATGG